MTDTPVVRRVPSAARYDYSPITARPSACWPNGSRLAVYVAMGVESYDFGSGQTENVLDGVPEPDLVNTSWRDYGNRVGAFRILAHLERLGIPPTLLLNTDVYDSAPAVVDEARRLGAELVAHGRSNSDSLVGYSLEQEAKYLRHVAECIAAHEGVGPGGWSSPWLAQTDHTLDLLGEVGYRYVLDLRLDDQPVWLNTREQPLLAMPYSLELNDSTSVIGRNVSASDFADMIVDEFDEMLATRSEQPLVMSVVLHSFITGAPFRLRRVARALEHISSHRDRVWLTQPQSIYQAMVAARAVEDQPT